MLTTLAIGNMKDVVKCTIVDMRVVEATGAYVTTNRYDDKYT